MFLCCPAQRFMFWRGDMNGHWNWNYEQTTQSLQHFVMRSKFAMQRPCRLSSLKLAAGEEMTRTDNNIALLDIHVSFGKLVFVFNLSIIGPKITIFATAV